MRLYVFENVLKRPAQGQIAHLADFLFRQVDHRLAPHDIADLKLAAGAVFRMVADGAIGRVFVQSPLDAVIGAVADNNAGDFRIYLFRKSFIGFRDRGENARDVFIGRVRRRAGDLFHHGAVDDADDAGVKSVMTIIIAVLAIMAGQMQSPFLAQLAGEPPGRRPHVHFGLLGRPGLSLRA